MKFLRNTLFLLLCFFSISAFAGTPNPTAMLQNTTDQLIAALKQNRAKLRSNPTFVYSLVSKILLPKVSVVAMSQSALGRQGWMKATPAQRKEFTENFTTTVIKTYASALNAYTDEKVKYFPIRGGYQGKQFIQVQSQIVRPSGPPVPITYSLLLGKDGWRIYNLNVEGISLLQSFRSQFSEQLSQGMSIAKIIANLKAHNVKIKAKTAS